MINKYKTIRNQHGFLYNALKKINIHEHNITSSYKTQRFQKLLFKVIIRLAASNSQTIKKALFQFLLASHHKHKLCKMAFLSSLRNFKVKVITVAEVLQFCEYEILLPRRVGVVCIWIVKSCIKRGGCINWTCRFALNVSNI